MPDNNYSNVKYEFGGNSEEILRCDIVIKSPGISYDFPLVKKIQEKNIPIVNELEVSYQFIAEKLKCVPKIIAISGTNGKTTTTTLVGLICKSYFDKVFVGGNIGVPLIEFYDRIDKDSIIVLEVSSYQLEDIIKFRPYISCLLNITPDHLEHHKTMENYINAKSRIFINQTEQDFAVLNYDDKTVYNLQIKHLPVKKVYFSKNTQLVEGTYLEKKSKKLVFVSDKFEKKEFLPKINIPGEHNIENILAAITCGCLIGVSEENITKTVSEFKGVEHRLEFVREINGVEYINDSKSTNVNSTFVALKSFDKPIHLIIGGRDKGSPYTPLIPLINSKVKSVLIIGEATDIIFCQLKEVKSQVYKCSNLDEAIKRAYSLAKENEVVLLSPACSSFDQFRNFEHRGKVFKELVYKL